MTHDDKIEYFRIAAGICNFSFKGVDLDKLVRIYDGILEKKEKYTIKDASIAIHAAESREEEKQNERIKEQLKKGSK